MWACPHCRLPLQASPDGGSITCARGHAFDLAREGYVNLLSANRKRTHDPGDSADMVAARRRVHDANLYGPLAEAVCQQLATTGQVGTVLDLGCGEGFYTRALLRALPDSAVYGIDISRAAIRLAAKQSKEACFAVASTYQLPLPEDSLDAVVRIFAPSEDAEVMRVLKPGHCYLEVSPGPRHLWQVREALYEEPREHAPARVNIPGMALSQQVQLQYELAPDARELADIISMTPFAHRGQGIGRARLRQAGLAAVTMAFSLCIFRLDT